ncbi:TPA: hypothetical protein QDA71_006692, partial [Burkholderia vietnamiensis]|nr:hypothetical protein [Burkholderia vietnamiensis]
MIDQDKMRALAKELRREYVFRLGLAAPQYRDKVSRTGAEAADAIDLLLAELEASDQKRKEAILDAEKARDERNRAHVKLNAEWIEKTNALRAELEAAAADKRDAMAFRDLMAKVIREINHGEYNHPYRGIENAPMHGHEVPGIWDSDNGAKAGTPCAWCATWNAARAALAQRQGEG